MSGLSRAGRHGTYADYVHGCRCAQCTAATAMYQRRRRAKQRDDRGGDGMRELDWQHDAACRGHNVDVWFPDSPHEIHPVAARRCAECPVAAECLDYALRHQVDGVWAGTVPVERKRLRRLRGITAVSIGASDLIDLVHPITDTTEDEGAA